MCSESMRLVREFLQKSSGTTPFQKTSSSNAICTRLPQHWRSNKSLPHPFTVLLMTPVADGTKITVHAGNDEANCGEVRNYTADFRKQVAKFSDLRFVGKSGRGKNFHLTLTIHTKPLTIIMVSRAIKVTVDGPRDARHPKKPEQIMLPRCQKRPLDSSIPRSLFPIHFPSVQMPLIQMTQMQQYQSQLQSLLYAPSILQFSSPPTVGMVRTNPSHPFTPQTPTKRKRLDSEQDKTPTIWRPF